MGTGDTLYAVEIQHNAGTCWKTYYHYTFPGVNDDGRKFGNKQYISRHNTGGGFFSLDGKQYVNVPLDQRALYLLYDATGTGADDYWVQNLHVEMRAVDEKAPQLLSVAPLPSSAIALGDTVYISLIYDEIVDSFAGAAPTLQTNLSDAAFAYAEGLGTNVLVFKGTATRPGMSGQQVTARLQGGSGIQDLSGKVNTTVEVTVPDANVDTRAEEPSELTVDFYKYFVAKQDLPYWYREFLHSDRFYGFDYALPEQRFDLRITNATSAKYRWGDEPWVQMTSETGETVVDTPATFAADVCRQAQVNDYENLSVVITGKNGEVKEITSFVQKAKPGETSPIGVLETKNLVETGCQTVIRFPFVQPKILGSDAENYDTVTLQRKMSVAVQGALLGSLIMSVLTDEYTAELRTLLKDKNREFNYELRTLRRLWYMSWGYEHTVKDMMGIQHMYPIYINELDALEYYLIYLDAYGNVLVEAKPMTPLHRSPSLDGSYPSSSGNGSWYGQTGAEGGSGGVYAPSAHYVGGGSVGAGQIGAGGDYGSVSREDLPVYGIDDVVQYRWSEDANLDGTKDASDDSGWSVSSVDPQDAGRFTTPYTGPMPGAGERRTLYLYVRVVSHTDGTDDDGIAHKAPFVRRAMRSDPYLLVGEGSEPVTQITGVQAAGITGATSGAWTKEPVELRASFTAGTFEIASIERPDGSAVSKASTATYAATQNGLYTFAATDEGNFVAIQSAPVNRIDAQRPTLSWSFAQGVTANNVQNQSKTVYLTAADNLTPLFNEDGTSKGSGGSGVARVRVNDGDVTLSNGKGQFDAAQNGAYTLEVTDRVGNAMRYTLNISGIDKEAPELATVKACISGTQEPASPAPGGWYDRLLTLELTAPKAQADGSAERYFYSLDGAGETELLSSARVSLYSAVSYTHLTLPTT